MTSFFGSLVRKARRAVTGVKEKDIRDTLSLRNKVQDALKAVGSRKGIKKMSEMRIIPIPKTGGMPALIPIIENWSNCRWSQHYSQCYTRHNQYEKKFKE